MQTPEALARQALTHVKQLQDAGRSFDSIATVLTSWPLRTAEPKQDERVIALQVELAAERAARLATDRVLAARCSELLELRESHALANETIRVLENRLSKLEAASRKRPAPAKAWWAP